MIPAPPDVTVDRPHRSLVARIRGGMKRLSLRARISMLVAVAVGLTVACASAAAYLTLRTQLLHQLDSSLRTRAAAAAAIQLDPQSILAQPTLLLLTAENKVFIVYADGDVVGNVNDRAFAVPLATGPEHAVAQGRLASSLRTLTVDGVAYRVVALPSAPGQALVLARSMEETTDTLNTLGLVLLVVGIAGIVVAAVSGLAIARAGLRPVEKLTEAAENIARTGTLTPIEVDRDDELGRLARSFNAMLAALERSRQRQKQLVADAGHELRTPLTSLRTNLDLLAQSERLGANGLAPAERLALLADVRAQIEELSELVADLVELAREEAPSAHAEEFDVAVVVERALERVRRRAPRLEFEVSLRSWLVVGDPEALERAVTNLLDNAAKWSPPAGRVQVRLDGGRLSVADQGPGIAEADLPYIFERFYRSADARKMPGSGLGLAIARQAVERHGGRIRAQRAPGGGALFVVELPGRPGTDSADVMSAVSTSSEAGPSSEDSAVSQDDAGVLRP